MTKRELENYRHMMTALESLGFDYAEREQLRRISMTLHRWHELECGDAGGCVERDEETGRTYWLSADTSKRRSIPDRETGARKRLDAIISARNKRHWHPIMPEAISAFIQTDPRGAALYILRPGDVPAGEDPSAYYSRGICVY